MDKCPGCGAGVSSKSDDEIFFNCGAVFHVDGDRLADCDDDYDDTDYDDWDDDDDDWGDDDYDRYGDDDEDDFDA